VSYEVVRQAEIKQKEEVKAIEYAWQMPPSVGFDENNIDECTQKNYAYNRCLLKKERSQPEKLFEQYLKDHAATICFWYKNGDSGKTNFRIRYAEEERIGTFYPDFIVGFNDGRIGIFDTKSGFTEKSSETKAKAEYLQQRGGQFGCGVHHDAEYVGQRRDTKFGDFAVYYAGVIRTEKRDA
jgi:hypothetical protein